MATKIVLKTAKLGRKSSRCTQIVQLHCIWLQIFDGSERLKCDKPKSKTKTLQRGKILFSSQFSSVTIRTPKQKCSKLFMIPAEAAEHRGEARPKLCPGLDHPVVHRLTFPHSASGRKPAVHHNQTKSW